MFKRLQLLLILLVAGSAIAVSQPKLVIEGGDTYDWGEVWQKDSPLKAKVKLHNKGTDSLIIFSVKPGCGCTTAPLDKTRLGPGEFTTMSVELKVGNNTGEVMKSIDISTSDPDAYRKKYYIKANVLVPLRAKQRYVFFPEAKVGEKSEFKLTIENLHDKPITFKDYVIVPEEVSINIDKDYVLQPGKEVTITVSVIPKRVGRLQGAMVIKTNIEEMPRLRVNIAGQVMESTPTKADKQQ